MKLFISYSRKDEPSAIRLYRDLSSSGLTVWFDKESLLAGQNWELEIQQAIRHSDFVLALLSTNSVSRRGFFLKELKLAVDTLDEIPSGHLYLLPARLDDCEIPPQVATVHYVDLFPDWTNGFQRLLKSLRHQAGQLQSDRANVDKVLQRLDELIQSPSRSVDLDELSRVLIAPGTLQDKVDAMEEIGIRGYGDARIFFALEQEALADTHMIPPGQVLDDITYVRQAALWTIGILNRPERIQGVPTNRIIGLDTIEVVLSDRNENPDVKSAAVQALMVINRPEDPQIASLLRNARRDRNPDVKRLAEEALRGRTI